MKSASVFREYRKILKADKYCQPNVATFTEFYEKLITCEDIKDSKKLEKVSEIYKSYMSMRDGCEINDRSIEDAINEMQAGLL